MLLFYLLLCVTFEWKPSENHHLSHEKAKPHAEIICPALNGAPYNDSHLLVTVTQATLCIVAVAVARVLTVILHLWLGGVTAKRAHPFPPAKQETKKLMGNFLHTLVKQQISGITVWKASSLTSIMIAGNLKLIVLDIVHGFEST